MYPKGTQFELSFYEARTLVSERNQENDGKEKY